MKHMERIIVNTNKPKQSVYGFRKAFIKNPSLSIEARFLLILLITFKGINPTCWPSLATLAKIMNRSRDSVRKYLKELRINGFLKIASRGIGRSHSYTPSYIKIYAGKSNELNQSPKPAEETLQRPDESFRDRSIVSGNINKDLKTGKNLFYETGRRLGFVKGASIT